MTLVKSTQEEVLTKLDMVEKALSNIKEESQRPMRTNGEFSFTNSSLKTISIHRLRDLSLLLEIVSFLTTKRNGYDLAAKTLNLDEYPPFRWFGYSYEDWVNDLQIRAAVLTSQQKREKLTEAKRILESLQSEETRTQKILSSLDSLLS